MKEVCTTPAVDTSSAREAGEFIRWCREQLGLTLAQFAADVQMTPAYVAQIESGASRPSPRGRRRIAGRLAVGAVYHA